MTEDRVKKPKEEDAKNHKKKEKREKDKKIAKKERDEKITKEEAPQRKKQRKESSDVEPSMRDRSGGSKREDEEPRKKKKKAEGESCLPPEVSVAEAKAFEADRAKQDALKDESAAQKAGGAFGAGTCIFCLLDDLAKSSSLFGLYACLVRTESLWRPCPNPLIWQHRVLSSCPSWKVLRRKNPGMLPKAFCRPC